MARPKSFTMVCYFEARVEIQMTSTSDSAEYDAREHLKKHPELWQLASLNMKHKKGRS